MIYINETIILDFKEAYELLNHVMAFTPVRAKTVKKLRKFVSETLHKYKHAKHKTNN